MQPLRLTIPTHLFGGPLRASLKQAADARADGVELDARNEVRPSEFTETACRQLRHYLSELGLGVGAVRFPARRTYFDANDLGARIQATRDAMELAQRLGTSTVNLRIGRIPNDPESSEYDVLRDVMNDLARFGNRVGAIPTITPSGDSIESLQRLLSDVTEGALLIDFDPASFVLSAQDTVAALRALHADIGHVRARDAIRHAGGSGAETELGRGEVAWDEFLALLHEADYRGWITADRTGGEDAAGDAVRAIRYLRNVAGG